MCLLGQFCLKSSRKSLKLAWGKNMVAQGKQRKLEKIEFECGPYFSFIMFMIRDMYTYCHIINDCPHSFRFIPGTKHSGTQFGWLVKLPKSLKCLSFQGNIPPIQPVLVAVGATLGATLRDLRIRTYALLGEADLDYISRYFVRLESLTCG